MKALAHPLRVRILALLEEATASPNELSRRLEAPLGNVSYHVRILHQLKLIKLVRKTPRRGALEHYYRAVGRATVTQAGWAQAPGIVKQALIGAALQQVGDYVGRAAAHGGFDRADSHLTRTTMRLDDRGWRELGSAMMKLLECAEAIDKASRERLHEKEAGEGREVGLVLMQFEATAFADEPDAEPRRSTPKKRSKPSTA